MRYAVSECSQTSHCCFAYTVVDTTKPMMVGDIHWKGWFEGICECFEEEDAVKIAAALNAQEGSTEKE